MAKIVANWVNQKKQWLVQIKEDGTLKARRLELEEPFEGGGGVSYITAGLGLLGGTIYSGGTISANFGTGVNQVARGNHTHDTRYYTIAQLDDMFENHYHEASAIDILDEGEYFSSPNVEGALQEVGRILNLDAQDGEYSLIRKSIKSLPSEYNSDNNEFMNISRSAPLINSFNYYYNDGVPTLFILGENRRYVYNAEDFTFIRSGASAPLEVPDWNTPIDTPTFRYSFSPAYSRPRLEAKDDRETVALGAVHPDTYNEDGYTCLVFTGPPSTDDETFTERAYEYRSFSAVSSPITTDWDDPRILLVHDKVDDNYISPANAARLIYTEDPVTNTLKGYTKYPRWSRLPGNEYASEYDRPLGTNKRAIPWIRQEYQAQFPEKILNATIDGETIYVVSRNKLYTLTTPTEESLARKYTEYYETNFPGVTTWSTSYPFPGSFYGYGEDAPNTELIETHTPTVIYENNESIVAFEHIFIDETHIYLSSPQSIIKLNKITLNEVARLERPVIFNNGWPDENWFIVDGKVYNNWFVQVMHDNYASSGEDASRLRLYNKETLALEREYIGYNFTAVTVNQDNDLIFYDTLSSREDLDWGVGQTTTAEYMVCVLKKTTPLLSALENTSNTTTTLHSNDIRIDTGESWFLTDNTTSVHHYLRAVDAHLEELHRSKVSRINGGSRIQTLIATASPNWSRVNVSLSSGWLTYNSQTTDGVASIGFTRPWYTESRFGNFSSYGFFTANTDYYIYYTYEITGITNPDAGLGVHFRAGTTSGVDVNTVGSGYIAKIIRPTSWLSAPSSWGSMFWHPEINFVDATFKKGTTGKITQIIVIPLYEPSWNSEPLTTAYTNYIRTHVIPHWPPGTTTSFSDLPFFKLPSYEELFFESKDVALDIVNIKSDITQLETQIENVVQDKNYVHNQQVSQAVWSIQHNLNKVPSVLVLDSFDFEMIGDIHVIDNNNITVTFTVPVFGKAYLN